MTEMLRYVSIIICVKYLRFLKTLLFMKVSNISISSSKLLAYEEMH